MQAMRCCSRRVRVKRSVILVLITVLGVLVGCQVPGQTGTTTTKPSKLSIPSDAVDAYLALQLLHTSFGGNVICAHDILGSERKGDAVELYLWALCEEFYCDQQRLEQGSGVSLPVAVEGERQDTGAWSLEHRTPRDGADYGQDIGTIFPRRILSQITPSTPEDITEFNRRVSALQVRISIAAQARLAKCQ